MENKFRLLRADEIDVRVGTVSKQKTGISLLLYKDARVDMDILDETVGSNNWKRNHEGINNQLFCSVSIWDNEKKEWVTKQDVGTESNTEAEKGRASDSFKRACVNWGIGRELYTAPFIWVSGNSDNIKTHKYYVKEIGYNEKREISFLEIASNKSNNAVFKFGYKNQIPTNKNQSLETKLSNLFELADAKKKSALEMMALMNDKFGVTASTDLTEKQIDELISIISKE